MSRSYVRPFVTINVAMTVDGKIDTFERQGAKISSSEDWQRIDELRAESDAIMVGGATLIEEDPRLTVKTPSLRKERLARGKPENPVKVGVLSTADLPLDSSFIQDGPARVLVFTSQQSSKAQVKRLESVGVEVFILGNRRVDLVQMLEKLKDLGIQRLLVEGGGTLNEALIRAGLVDEIKLYISPLIFGGARAPTLADGQGLDRENAIHLQRISFESHNDGSLLITYRILK